MEHGLPVAAPYPRAGGLPLLASAPHLPSHASPPSSAKAWSPEEGSRINTQPRPGAEKGEMAASSRHDDEPWQRKVVEQKGKERIQCRKGNHQGEKDLVARKGGQLIGSRGDLVAVLVCDATHSGFEVGDFTLCCHERVVHIAALQL